MYVHLYINLFVNGFKWDWFLLHKSVESFSSISAAVPSLCVHLRVHCGVLEQTKRPIHRISMQHTVKHTQNWYSEAQIIRTKTTRKFCVNWAECVNGVNGEAYNCAHSDWENYPGCANKWGSSYLGYTVTDRTFIISLKSNLCMLDRPRKLKRPFCKNLEFLQKGIDNTRHCFSQ